MFEKVNPAHPDKVADRIAGAIVDMALRIPVSIAKQRRFCEKYRKSGSKLPSKDDFVRVTGSRGTQFRPIYRNFAPKISLSS